MKFTLLNEGLSLSLSLSLCLPTQSFLYPLSFFYYCIITGATSSLGYVQDYQEVKVQEQVQKLDVGQIPRSLWVVLENDLVDSCKAGDDVTIM